MSADLHERFQLAILGDRNVPVGSGLALSDRHVITCTHVAAQATTGNKDANPRADVEIRLRAIPWAGDGPITASLRADAWRERSSVPGDLGVRDLAILELNEPLPRWRGLC